MFDLLRAGSPVGVLCKAAALCLLSVAAATHALGQSPHAHQGPADAPKAERGSGDKALVTKDGKSGVIRVGDVRVEIPDVWVTDQDGRKARFYSDLIEGKVVVLHFFFTSCTYICPMQRDALSKLKARLGDRLGRDVFFVSVSKDPETDTPERLKRWGNGFGAGRGWTLVTGEKAVMAKLVRTMIGEGLGPDLHLPAVVVGNDKTGTWAEAGGILSTEEFVKIINSVAAGESR